MSGQSQRYFIGLALPEELSGQLFDFKWRLHHDIKHSLKPLMPHITLLHPSSLQNISPEELLPKIKELAAPYLPFTIELQTVEAFEREVLYIKVDSPELVALQSQLVGLLPPKEQAAYHQRTYTPHLTLAQVRHPHELDVETLHKLTLQTITLPCQVPIRSISYFTQVNPREYIYTVL